MQQSHFVEVEGKKTRYVTVGSGVPACVMLHGWGGSVDSFLDGEIPQTIAEKTGGQVVVLDVIGFGQSNPPDESGWSSTDYAQWLSAFLQSQKLENVPLVGHSNGGRIILRYSIIHPHSAPIVLLAASGIQWPLSKKQKVTQLLSRFGKIIPVGFKNFLLKKVFKAHDWANAPQSLKSTLSKLTAEPCMRNELNTIKNEVLLVWGEHDTMTPIRSAKVLYAELPSARLTTISDGRHGIHRTHSAFVSQQIIGFIS